MYNTSQSRTQEQKQKLIQSENQALKKQTDFWFEYSILTVQPKHQNQGWANLTYVCIVHHTCTKHPFEGHQTLCTEISVWQLFCRKNFWKSDSQSNTCKLKSNWIFSIVLDYISMNNKKLVCFDIAKTDLRYMTWCTNFWINAEEMHAFAWCIPAPKVSTACSKNCAQEFLILSTLKIIIVAITIIAAWWMYIFIKDRVSPTGRDGAVPHTSRKFAYSSHHLEKLGNPPLPAAKFGIPP